MTIGTFKLIKGIIIVWMVLIVIGSVLFLLDDDSFLYLIQSILAIMTIWFLTKISVKGKEEEQVDIELK